MNAVFVVEDDPDISRLIRHHLESANFPAKVFAGVSGVIAEAERTPPALFLLDVMLPASDGFELGRRIRRHPGLGGIPIIFLTARSSESDKLEGLALGADDYVTKPFSPRELIARVRAVLRRFEQRLPEGTLRVGDLEIDSASVTLRVRGQAVETTATEFRLLHYLVSHPGRVFTRDALLDAVWRDTAFVTPRSVDVYVRRLREKIESSPEEPSYLRTVRGIGYKFEAPK